MEASKVLTESEGTYSEQRWQETSLLWSGLPTDSRSCKFSSQLSHNFPSTSGSCSSTELYSCTYCGFFNYSHLLWFLRRLLTHEAKPRNKLHEDNKIRCLKAFYLPSNAAQKAVWVNPLHCFSAGMKQSWKEQDNQQLQLWTHYLSRFWQKN